MSARIAEHRKIYNYYNHFSPYSLNIARLVFMHLVNLDGFGSVS